MCLLNWHSFASFLLAQKNFVTRWDISVSSYELSYWESLQHSKTKSLKQNYCRRCLYICIWFVDFNTFFSDALLEVQEFFIKEYDTDKLDAVLICIIYMWWLMHDFHEIFKKRVFLIMLINLLTPWGTSFLF